MRVRLTALLLVLAAGLGVGAGATVAQDAADPTTAQAFAVQVAPAGADQAVVAAVAAPPGGGGPGGAYAYPADGSVVSAASVGSTAALDGTPAEAAGTAEATGVSLFGGEIAATRVALALRAAPGPAVDASFEGSLVEGLVVLGQPVEPTPGLQLPLADWGTLTVLSQSVGELSGTPPSAPASTAGLTVTLSAEHGGLPAGSRVVVGFVGVRVAAPAPAETTAAATQAETQTTTVAPVAPTVAETVEQQPPPPTTTRAAPAPEPAPAAPAAPAPRPTRERPAPRPAQQAPPAGEPEPPPPAVADPNAAKGLPMPEAPLPGPAPDDRPLQGGNGIPVLPAPGDVSPELTKGGYVFPVFGDSGYSASFGAPRADTGWHHGVDVFGQLGAPLLAVADGTVYSVGWNDVGGNRLWLRDDAGNEFYYAHLSAFSPAAVEGARVKAGTVVGFMGNTGDAEGTPPHVHFEIHPVSLLFMGYDGVVDPFPFLNAWKRRHDLRITAVAGWAPSAAARASAPKPGAMLLQSADISSASGLDPGSLERALADARRQAGDPATAAGGGGGEGYDPAAAEGSSGG